MMCVHPYLRVHTHHGTAFILILSHVLYFILVPCFQLFHVYALFLFLFFFHFHQFYYMYGLLVLFVYLDAYVSVEVYSVPHTLTVCFNTYVELLSFASYHHFIFLSHYIACGLALIPSTYFTR